MKMKGKDKNEFKEISIIHVDSNLYHFGKHCHCFFICSFIRKYWI